MKDAKTLTVRQAALKLSLTQKYIRDLLYEEKLPGAKKVGSKWLIPSAAIEARLKQHEARNG
ncbi:MAG TPA: helix-turn-helix domain-containing protein [Terriglobales bacterium]|nr:helix-turn-helix domain-containing protein [Terriglobales bacterium]